MSKKSENVKLVSGRKASNGRVDSRVLPGAPIGVMRLVAEHAEMKGPGEQHYWDLVKAIASDVAAADTLDYLAVVDVAEETYAILFLRKTYQAVFECMLVWRRDKLDLEARSVASARREAAESNRNSYNQFMEGFEDPKQRKERQQLWVTFTGNQVPLEHILAYDGDNSGSDIAEITSRADTLADDGQAFLDSMDALERIAIMINGAEKRRDKALDDIVTRRRKLGERLRASSNRIIDGTINVDDSDQ